MDFRKLKKIVQFDTAGWIALSSILLCGVSGFLLTIPYDFTRPYESVFEILLFNPTGSLIRNFHYWSAQLFIISILLHLYDHFSKSTESKIRNFRTWLVLAVSVLIVGYEMLSGFILKGDGAGLQAGRILASLLESVPVAGNLLRSAFASSEDHWQIVYVQHIATGTIFLLIAAYEHLKTIWPSSTTILKVLAGLLLISLFFRAPLGFTESNQLFGPWFFLGIQEMLHWTSHPIYIVFLMLIWFGLLVILPKLGLKGRRIVKRIFFSGTLIYLIIVLLVLLFRGENWKWKDWSEIGFSDEPVAIFSPVIHLSHDQGFKLPENARKEGCLLCHAAMKGLSDSHQPSATGCFVCHRGDPFSSDKQAAHKNMILEPGNFSNVRQTCGTQNCHREISDRIMGSMMNSGTGIVGTDRKIFGETSSLQDTAFLKNLGQSAADDHLRNLCAGCHLGMDKKEPGNAAWLERGGGCSACHLFYNPAAISSLKQLKSGNQNPLAEIHPSIDLQISNDRCKSCHSRSGRISLGYEGCNETNLKPVEVKDSTKFKILSDDRVIEWIQDDVHHQKGLSCIDCHGSYELMGDGKHHSHQEEAVDVQCIDCHPSEAPNTSAIGKLTDRESLMISGLRKYDPRNRVVVTAKNNFPLLNTRVDSLNRIILTNKLTGEFQESKRMSPFCSKGLGHSRLACESCHSAWVPQCIGCHTSFEKSTPGVDLLTGKPTVGSWIEYAGKNFAEPPTLGVNEIAGGKIIPTMPGMILTIDQNSYAQGKSKTFRRLYAPASGHTTQRASRSCRSCHNNPLAIGYGRGELKYDSNNSIGKWTFTPRFARNENDQLPEDAWIGFLQEAVYPWSTRMGLRPFTIKEQKRILEVGSCLTCHDEKSGVMGKALDNFQQSLEKRSAFCR